MAIAGIYYIDTLNFADATAVYSDEALTTFAPDGFYQMGGISAREQVSGILKPAENCPSCTTPIPDATPIPNNAYSVKDTVTGNFDHVILNTNFNLQTEVTTSINTNCWLIIAGVVQSTANTITGQCIRIPDADPLYYQLNICPVSSSNDAPSSIYVNENQAPTASQFIYLNTTNSSYYSYNDIAPVTIPLSNIPIVTTIAQTALTACPDVPPVFTYWNAQQCTDPNNTIVIQAPENTSFTEGTTSVKINGSETCYQITTQRIGSATTFDGIYAGTAYTGCTSGASPCIPPAIVFNSFVATNIDTGVAYDVQIGNGTQGDQTQINAATGCYELGIQTTRTTTNEITSPCQTEASCETYELQVGTYQIKECSSGVLKNITVVSNVFDNQIQCSSIVPIAVAPAAAATLRGPCQPTDISTGNFYYLVEPCSGGNSFIVNSGKNQLTPGNAIKLIGQGAICYKVLGTSNNADQTFTPSGSFASCAPCAPTCFGIAVEFAVGRDTCPTGGNTTVWSSTNSLVTASKLYETQEDCQSNTGTAPTGTYSFTFTNAAGQLEKISRYWTGSSLEAQQPCGTGVNITATITAINNNITGSSEGVGYTLTGSSLGSTITGPSPLGISGFNTNIQVNNGFTLTPSSKSITYNPNVDINSNTDITVTLEAEILEDPSTYVYTVTTCGTSLNYRVSSETSYGMNSVVVFRLNSNGQDTCGTIINITTDGNPQGNIFLDVTNQGGCFFNQCVSDSGPDGGSGGLL